MTGVALKGSGQGGALGCCWLHSPGWVLQFTVQYKRLGSPSVSLTCQQPPGELHPQLFSPPSIATNIIYIIFVMETLVLFLTA